MLENAIPRLLTWVPPSLRNAIIGHSDHPSWVATLTHDRLNRIRPPDSRVFNCRGPIERLPDVR